MLGRIRPVAEVTGTGMKVNLYGRNGSGKTSLACTFPKPLLLVGFEDGTKSVRRVKGVDFVQVLATPEVDEIISLLRQGGKYQTVVIDTATSMQDLVLTELLGLSEVPVMLSWGTVTQQQYRARSEKTRELLRKFLDLAPSGLNVVILAQEKNHTEKDDEGGGDSELLMPSVASSLGKTTCGWLQDNCDHVMQTYTRMQTETYIVKLQGKEIEKQRQTGKIEFCLRTQRAHPMYAAKIRADRGLELPDCLADPSYQKFVNLVQGGGP